MKASSLKSQKFVIGTKALKEAKLGRVKKVVYAKNCPPTLLVQLKTLEKLGLELERYNGDSKSLGIALGKPFPVSIAGARR